MAWEPILLTLHILGTVLGVGAATFWEIFYLKFKSVMNGQLEPRGNSFFAIIFRVILIGAGFLIVSSAGYVFYYASTGQTNLLLRPAFLAKLTIVGFLALDYLLVMSKKIAPWLASSISLASWYSALILGVWRDLQVSYLVIIFAYLVFVGIAVIFLSALRKSFRISRVN